jgi:predicted ATP-grasp superfamily ATP-dependent carboligase
MFSPWGSIMNLRYPAVLVLGVVPSLTWLVARCLRLAGRAPVVLAWHAASPLMLSADCHRYLSWAALKKAGDQLTPAAMEQVREACHGHAIDLVMAADYDTALLLASNQPHERIRCSAVPQAGTISELNNKWTLSRRLLQWELPVPESELIDSERALRQTSLPFPIITKPLDKWASVGFEIHPDRPSLARTLDRHRLQSGYPLLAQRYVPGWDVGASFLARDGKLVAYSLFHNRKRGERTFFADPRLRYMLERFACETHYSGVGHLDLRYDPQEDDYRILELNPRFWASLLYANGAGLNYPDVLARLEDWNGKTVRTSCNATVRLAAYERLMTLGNRWFSVAYEKLTRAAL